MDLTISTGSWVAVVLLQAFLHLYVMRYYRLHRRERNGGKSMMQTSFDTGRGTDRCYSRMNSGRNSVLSKVREDDEDDNSGKDSVRLEYGNRSSSLDDCESVGSLGEEENEEACEDGDQWRYELIKQYYYSSRDGLMINSFDIPHARVRSTGAISQGIENQNMKGSADDMSKPRTCFPN